MIEHTPVVERPRMIWHSPVDEPNWGECPNCDETFEDRDEFDEHRESKHPRPCSNWHCRRAARYKVQGSPHSYCPGHADKKLEPTLGMVRVNSGAEIDLPTLPDDHPIEEVIQGLEQ